MKYQFTVGTRLRSKVSGLIWIVSDTQLEPPGFFSHCIPVRKTNWPRDTFCWQDPENFEKAYE